MKLLRNAGPHSVLISMAVLRTLGPLWSNNAITSELLFAISMAIKRSFAHRDLSRWHELID